MGIERIIGIVLLAAGVGIIGYALFSSFMFFTVQSSPPEIFPLQKAESFDSSPKNIAPGNFEEALSRLMEKQLGNILPAETLPKILNLTLWSLFAGILIFAGAQISTLGIKLIKQ